jgi:hypothetical protein
LIILMVVVALVVRLWRYSLYTAAVKLPTNTACLHNDTIKAHANLYVQTSMQAATML